MIRLLSGTVSNYVPMGSGINMVTKMFDSTVKNIHNDFVGQGSQFPFVKTKDLPMVIDSWTGQPVGHIDNPWMRAFNAVSPFPMIDGPEPWREKLNTSGWRGLSALKRFYWFCRIQSRRIRVYPTSFWLTTTLETNGENLDKPKYVHFR